MFAILHGPREISYTSNGLTAIVGLDAQQQTGCKFPGLRAAQKTV
jgi:hypothetical protein